MFIYSGEHSEEWIDGGRPFVALQQLRIHPKIGRVVETRGVINDNTFKRILFMQFRLLGEGDKEDIICNRILKPINNS